MRVRDAIPGLAGATSIVVALPVLWFAQGSAYVALKIGVASVPPLLFSGARFALVGVLLLGWSAWRAGWRLRIERQELVLGAVAGAGIVLAAQGGASWASQSLAPGVVAVLTSTVPLWAAVIGWIAFRARIGGAAGALGLVAGFAGVAFLAWPGGGSGIALVPALVAAGGAAGWGAAVVVVGRAGRLRRPLLVASLQALIGGGLQLVVALVTGEPGHVLPQQLVAAVPVFAYLVVVPSLVGLPLLIWLLTAAPIHVANTAAYAAPVIALGLGWLLLAEPVTPRTAGGVAVILAGVALMVWGNRAPARDRRGAELEERAA